MHAILLVFIAQKSKKKTLQCKRFQLNSIELTEKNNGVQNNSR